MKDRRICIVVSMGWGVRNVLMSKAMDLIAKECETHVFSSFNELRDFRERFGDVHHLESLIDAPMPLLARLIYHWNTYTFYKISPSRTHREKLAAVRSKDKRIATRFIAKFSRRFGSRHLFNLSRILLREAFRFGEQYKRYKTYFQEQRIDTLISGNPFNPTEYPALTAAKDLGIKTVGIITSWDNLSSKRALIIDFDQYLVWNKIMAAEIKWHYRVSERQIFEIGPLQFDFYFDRKYWEPRGEFCRKFGFDPERKIVVYSTVTSQLMPDEPGIIEKLLLGLRDGRIVGSPNLLVRLHPKRDCEEFRALRKDERWKRMRVAWSLAGKPVRGKNDKWCPLDEEIRLLTNTVRHGDVNLNIFSTMLLDFAVLDKPAVLISHDSSNKRVGFETYEHLRPVVSLGSHRISYSLEETVEWLNEYLEKPELDWSGRKALIKLECGEFLGRSWERLEQAILQGCEEAKKREKNLSEGDCG